MIRELRSPRLMGLSLWLLALGCFLRASAYSSTGGPSWKVLPISAFLELAAVCTFALNLGWSMMQRVPAWFGLAGINPRMTVYFCVASFPKSKQVLINSGLKTKAKVREIPRSLTLEEAAAADHADLSATLAPVRAFSRTSAAASNVENDAPAFLVLRLDEIPLFWELES